MGKLNEIHHGIVRLLEESVMNGKVNPSSYNVNRNAVPMEEILKESQEQGGRLVARSPDGIDTYLYADSYEEIYRLLEERGILPHQAVVDRVRVFDEGEIF
jgi:hypothetical protein